MTFAVVETSIDDGQPLELMKVTYLTNNWCYTTSEHDVSYDGNVYTPMPITHGDVETTADIAKAQLTVKVATDCPVGELFRVQSPSGVVSITLFAKHANDAEVKVNWKGRIVNSEWDYPWLSFTCESVMSSLQRTGLRRKYGMQCPLALYGQGRGMCNVNRETFRQDCVVSAISGATITAAGTGRPDSYFSGGYLTWLNDVTGTLEKRMINESYSNGNMVITSWPPGLSVGGTVSLYPGCDHSSAVCNSVFNNVLNYGGMPFIPTKNPFNGSTLY